MIETKTIITILLMASATYLTRIGGYLFLRRRAFSQRTTAVLESAPGCVLITVIAPLFVTGKPADLIALGVTMLAASRVSVLTTVFVAIVTAGLLRAFIG